MYYPVKHKPPRHRTNKDRRKTLYDEGPVISRSCVSQLLGIRLTMRCVVRRSVTDASTARINGQGPVHKGRSYELASV